MKLTILLAGVSLLASQAAAGNVSNVDGTLDTTLVDPAPSLYPHFICASGCNAGSNGNGVTQSGPWSVGVSNFPATQTVEGAVTVPGVATSANQPALDLDGGGLAHITNFPSLQAVSGAVSVNNLPAIQPVSGSISISNLPASQAITGTISVGNFPATQPITGSVTLVDPTPGSYPHFICDSGCSTGGGGGAVTQSGAWSVGVSNFPTTQSVTGSVTLIDPAPGSYPHFICDSGCAGGGGGGGGAVTQSGAWNVGISNFPANQAVSAASLPLPSGAATSTNQTAPQSAPGTPQAVALTIQGNASSIAVPVSNSAEAAAMATLTAAAAAAVPCAVTAVAPTYTTGSTQPQSCNQAGALRVDGSGVTQPISGAVSVSGTVQVSLASAPNTPIGGVTSSGATLTENPVAMGGRAATASPTAVSDGQKVAAMYTPDGKAVVKLFAPNGLDWRAFQSTTGSSAITLQAAGAAGVKNYLTGVQCWNTSTTTITLTFSDTASTQIVVPAGSGNNAVFPTPLATAAAAALTFSPSSAQTTIGCAAQGFTGS